MPISLDTLTNYSTRFSTNTNIYKSNQTYKKAFLCHSHSDSQYIKGFIELLREEKIHVYVDWLDSSMPDNTNRETAVRIQQKIQEADYFFFLATHNSVRSRWCPWEIGYADGVKKYETIFIIPTVDRVGNFYGNEYLQLYQKIDRSKQGPLAFWKPNAENGRFMSSL